MSLRHRLVRLERQQAEDQRSAQENEHHLHAQRVAQQREHELMQQAFALVFAQAETTPRNESQSKLSRP